MSNTQKNGVIMDEKEKDGMSVRDIEGYAKRYRFEIFFCLLYIFASLFTLIFWGAAISVFLTGLGGILGALFPHKIAMFSKKTSAFIYRHDKTTQLIIGIAALAAAIFVAPLIFLITGLQGGRGLISHSNEMPRV